MREVLSECPPNHELVGLLGGELSESVLERVSQHLEQCPQCTEKLHELDRGQGALADDQNPRRDWCDEPQFVLAMARCANIRALSQDESNSSTDSIPTHLGRYQVRSVLGGGSFGKVYLGFDPDTHRDVALKVARQRLLSSPKEEARFLAEARCLAQLDHPGIVKLFDVGRNEAGLLFLVTQYIRGVDLSSCRILMRILAFRIRISW